MIREHYKQQGGGGEILPAGYTRLTYIQGDGSRYIDLGIKGGDKVHVIINCSTHQATGGTIFGYYNTNSPYNKCYMGFGSVCNLGYGTGYNVGYSPSYGLTLGVRYNMEFQVCSGDSWLKMDGRTLFSTNETAAYLNNLNFYLLGRNNGGSAGAYTRARVYDLYIYIDDVLKGHFVPALRNSDGKSGLWDFKRETFLTNSGGAILPYSLS